jgi:hypothetical protein
MQTRHHAGRAKSLVKQRQGQKKENQSQHMLDGQQYSLLRHANIPDRAGKTLPGCRQYEQRRDRQQQPTGPAQEKERTSAGTYQRPGDKNNRKPSKRRWRLRLHEHDKPCPNEKQGGWV